MKKVFGLVLMAITSFTLTTSALAAETTNVNDIDSLYKNAYNQAKNEVKNEINDDYGAYAYLVDNLDQIIVSERGINLKPTVYSNLETEEKPLVKDFVTRLNTLIKENAVTVNNNLVISHKKIPEDSRVILHSEIMELMPEARAHAKQLKKVYDNAIFSQKHLIAGAYFTERVKSGGIWDYKQYLGLKTRYFESELQAIMTGETIGNFHYGYVGSVCFGPTTLKSAAGLVQIISGTSSTKYWKSYFDDPSDQKDIQWGINKYNADN
ncbi:polymorphic toxin type 44 domain-containing protein [Lacrimispora sp. JR3]|uniref:polymorphic toxin type 44 domain-containing protein n=1 Tax=Lacrimispora sinapis TaxID=3111456 RepID=UPI00374A51C1